MSAPANQFHVFGGNERLLGTLLKHQVRFLVVGGLAVRYFAPQRPVNDLDLLVEQTPENAQALFAALAAEHVCPGFPIELLNRPSERPQQMPLKDLHFADLLTGGKAIDFSAEWEHANIARIGSHVVRFASRELLVKMKSGTGRARDEEDITLLGGGV